MGNYYELEFYGAGLPILTFDDVYATLSESNYSDLPPYVASYGYLALKYLWRFPKRGGVLDLKKALYSIENMLTFIEANNLGNDWHGATTEPTVCYDRIA